MPLPYVRRLLYERAYYLKNKEKRKAAVKRWRERRRGSFSTPPTEGRNALKSEKGGEVD